MSGNDLKKYLKENGIDTSNISIKHSYCGYSESYDVTIKDENISRKEVDNLLKKFEYYERDERTGEILEGGNTYILVDYDYDLCKEVNDKYNSLILDKIDNELSKRTNLEQIQWTNGETNPVLNLSERIICYKNGKSTMIQNLDNYDCYQSGESYLAETMLKMGILKDVVKYLQNEEVIEM